LFSHFNHYGRFFSIERFLKEAKIKEKDIPRYVEFLQFWGLDETNVQLLTEERITEERIINFGKEYKKEHSDFVLVPAHAAAIADTAKKWGKGLLSSLSFSPN
jgi:hypothetical protein